MGEKKGKMSLDIVRSSEDLPKILIFSTVSQLPVRLEVNFFSRKKKQSYRNYDEDSEYVNFKIRK